MLGGNKGKQTQEKGRMGHREMTVFVGSWETLAEGWGGAQLVDCLPSRQKGLDSIPRIT